MIENYYLTAFYRFDLLASLLEVNTTSKVQNIEKPFIIQNLLSLNTANLFTGIGITQN
jgi:hypothetical protein